MSAEMGNEAVEIITMVMDKYLATKNYEVRSKSLHNDNSTEFIHL